MILPAVKERCMCVSSRRRRLVLRKEKTTAEMRLSQMPTGRWVAIGVVGKSRIAVFGETEDETRQQIKERLEAWRRLPEWTGVAEELKQELTRVGRLALDAGLTEDDVHRAVAQH
jgi:hypothetical protein